MPKMPVIGLCSIDKPHSNFQVLLDHQSQEEESVNGNSPFVPYGSNFSRYPFLLLLDGIVCLTNPTSPYLDIVLICVKA